MQQQPAAAYAQHQYQTAPTPPGAYPQAAAQPYGHQPVQGTAPPQQWGAPQPGVSPSQVHRSVRRIVLHNRFALLTLRIMPLNAQSLACVPCRQMPDALARVHRCVRLQSLLLLQPPAWYPPPGATSAAMAPPPDLAFAQQVRAPSRPSVHQCRISWHADVIACNPSPWVIVDMTPPAAIAEHFVRSLRYAEHAHLLRAEEPERCVCEKRLGLQQQFAGRRVSVQTSSRGKRSSYLPVGAAAHQRC